MYGSDNENRIKVLSYNKITSVSSNFSFFLDTSSSASRPLESEGPTGEHMTLKRRFCEPEQHARQMHVDLNQQQQHHHHSQLDALTQSVTSSNESSNTILSHQIAGSSINNNHVPNLGNTEAPVSSGLQFGKPSLTPTLTQAPTDSDAHSDFHHHQSVKKPKLSHLPDMPHRTGTTTATPGGSLPLLCPRFPTSTTIPSSSICSCPDFHASLLTITKLEHHLRTKMMQEEMKLKLEEHNARMKILTLRENILKARMMRIRIGKSERLDEDDENEDSTDSCVNACLDNNTDCNRKDTNSHCTDYEFDNDKDNGGNCN